MSNSRIRRVRSPIPALFSRDRDSSREPPVPELPSGFTHSRTRSYNEGDLSSSSRMHEELASNATRLDRRMSHQQTALQGMRRFEKRMTAESAMAKTSRLAQLNPLVDLRVLDYVSSYDANLMCPICRCPFVDPVVLAECDHCFCRDCIRQCWVSSSYTPHGPRGDCPTCRTSAKLGPRTAMSKILNNILEELVVKCPKEEDGCQAEMKRGEVQDHVRIYCGYAFVECSAEDCGLPVRRKDFVDGECQHSFVSCLDCHSSMRKSDLESHWRSQCPDRSVKCELCKSQVPYRSLNEHREEACPATRISCPGKDLGCDHRSRKTLAESHANDCVFAKLAPAIKSQKDRLDAQEAAQKQMARKLEVFQIGFEKMKEILAEASPAGSSKLSYNDDGVSPVTNDLTYRPTPSTENYDDFAYPALAEFDPALSGPPTRPAPAPPIALSADGTPTSSNAATLDFDLATSSFPPVTTAGGLYDSPFHHLLSMHESLRDEMSRINTAVQELEGRHSMQILNENLRIRDEISYIGAQVAGLSRQVHWLTSVQLQHQQHRRPGAGPSTGPGGSTGGSGISDIANAGAGVEAAVQSAASALRDVTRRVSGGDGSGNMQNAGQRQRSDEGRTKL